MQNNRFVKLFLADTTVAFSIVLLLMTTVVIFLIIFQSIRNARLDKVKGATTVSLTDTLTNSKAAGEYNGNLIRDRGLEIILVAQLIALFIYFSRRYLHPHIIAKSRAKTIKKLLATFQSYRPI